MGIAERLATLDVAIRGKFEDFFEKADQFDKRLDKMTGKANTLADTMQSVGVRVGAIGASITAGLGFSMRASIQQMEAFRDLASTVDSLGLSWDENGPKIKTFFEGLQEVTDYGEDQFIPVMQRQLLATRDINTALENTRLAAQLASAGYGDMGTMSLILTQVQAGNIAILKRWIPEARELNVEFRKHHDLAGAAAWGMQQLSTLASKAPEPTGWNLMTKALGELQESIGDAITLGMDPWFKRAERVIQIGEDLAKTGFGKVAIQGTALTGVLATVTGGLLIFGAQSIKSLTYLRSLTKQGGALGTVLQTLGKVLGPVGLVAMAALAGWELGNLANRFQVVREWAQRSMAAVMAGINGLKGVFGDEQAKKDAQIYWDIATGKIPVGEEPIKNVSAFKWMSDKILEIMDDTREGPEKLAREFDKVNDAAGDVVTTLSDLVGPPSELAMPEKEYEFVGPEAPTEEVLAREEDLRNRLKERRGLYQELLAAATSQRDALIQQYGTEENLINTAAEVHLARFNELEEQIASYQTAIANADPWTQMVQQMQAASDLTDIGFSTMMQGVQGLGNLIGAGLRKAFGQADNAVTAFIQDLLLGFAQAISQALILKAIMAIFGKPAGGGILGFLSGLWQQPRPDFMARFEGGRFAQLFMQGIRRELPLGATGALATATAGTTLAARPYEVRPVIHVTEATPMTKVRVYDEWFEPRRREREDLTTEAD